MDISNVILSSNYGLPHPLNEQTIFDKCALHLIHQGRRSLLGGYGRCAYRGDDGAACAVGALISDERYNESMEDKSALQIVPKFMPELVPYGPLLNSLQELHDIYARTGDRHDSSIDMTKLVEGLRDIAAIYDLSCASLADPHVSEVIAPTLPAEITSLLRPSLAKTEA